MDLPRGHDSVLVVIDVQDRLVQAMPPKVSPGNIGRMKKLLIAARILGIPRLYTEQYPQGLGPTIPAIKEELDGAPRFEKLCFSSFDCAPFQEELHRLSRSQVILCGIEAHVCVLQTAFALKGAGFSPWVVEDAVLSRFKEDFQSACHLMRSAGIPLLTTEIIIFGWLRGADHPNFRELSRLLKERDS